MHQVRVPYCQGGEGLVPAAPYRAGCWSDARAELGLGGYTSTISITTIESKKDIKVAPGTAQFRHDSVNERQQVAGKRRDAPKENSAPYSSPKGNGVRGGGVDEICSSHYKS